MALFRLKKDVGEKKTSEDVVISDAQEAQESAEKIKEKSETKPEKKIEKKVASLDILSLNYNKDMSSVLKHPRVTEKATLQAEKGVYVFDVSPRATKKDVRDAVENLYKVSPRKINIISVPSKRMRIRGKQNKFGVKSGGKKAYVYVKKGDTIDIV